jgi:catechol 2,3-dioxygenase-like lactoylglutathione lyase family enzyme
VLILQELKRGGVFLLAHDPEDCAAVFTADIRRTLTYYKDKLGFECMGTWQDQPVYATVARDQHAIHFRFAEPPAAHPDKYPDELLDLYLLVEDADAFYAEYAAQSVEFARELGNTIELFYFSEYKTFPSRIV